MARSFHDIKRGEKQRLSVQLDLNDPEKDGDVWILHDATCTVLDENWEPVEDAEIGFFRNGVRSGRETTNDHGEARHTFRDLTDGSYVFEARIARTPKFAKHTLRIRVPRVPPRPAKLTVSRSGSNGSYILHIGVFAENSAPVEGVRVRVLDLIDSARTEWTDETDEFGVVDYPVNWVEKERDADGNETGRTLRIDTMTERHLRIVVPGVESGKRIKLLR